MDQKSALIAGVLAGVGASLCCVAPLALLSLGLGGAWVASLAAFEPARPVFLVFSLFFVGLAFRKLYLAPRACEPGKPCAEGGTLRWQRVVFWAVAIPLLGLLAFPWFAPCFIRGKAMKTRILLFFLTFTVAPGAVLAMPRTVTLDVQNMTCGVCPLTVKKALARVPGVQHVAVD